MIRSPSHSLVERIASEEARRTAVEAIQVLGVCRSKAAIKARKRAWVRLVRSEGYPILGVAIVWGCERRGIQRALRDAAA